MALSLSRRGLFRFAAATACPLCARAREPEHEPHWGYEGPDGPEHWGDLSPDFKACSLGTQQSPIEVRDPIRAQLGPVTFHYRTIPLTIWNNGHTIQVNTPPGCEIDIGGNSYVLTQFHFHHPSEHILAGKSFDMEAHFVHEADNGAVAVVGVFIRPGTANPGLAPIWTAMPPHEGPAHLVPGVTVEPGALLPRYRDYFRYMGSLTTPPCTEGLTWTVFRAPIQASPEQIRAFAALFPMNARPPQPLNRRFVLED